MFSFIVAMDENKGIGYKNHLPWKDLEELAHFKEITQNMTLIMGSNTYNNLPKKLENRKILLASKNGDIKDLKAFLIKEEKSKEEYIIAGGESIYNLAYPFCEKAYVSIMKGKYTCDTYFSLFNMTDFSIIKEEQYSNFNYFLLRRKVM